MPTPLSFHDNRRGFIGFISRITGSDGNTRGGVIQAVAVVDSDGNAAGAGTVASPSATTDIGSTSLAISQATSSISPAAANVIVAARTGRRAVVLTNITGTQPIYFVANAVTTGATTGFFLAGTAGASVTLSTAAAVFATSPTAAQTLGVVELF